MRKRNKQARRLSPSSGFSLLEVLLGISVFMIGMLGVTALNISSLKSNTYSGNLSEATIVAASKLEELMDKDFADANGIFLTDLDCDGSGQDCSPYINQDANFDGVDDDGGNFGLDDVSCPSGSINDADYCDTVIKNNITYNVYWNVAENEPISIDPALGEQSSKMITVIVEWLVKDEPRRISMSTIRHRE